MDEERTKKKKGIHEAGRSANRKAKLEWIFRGPTSVARGTGAVVSIE